MDPARVRSSESENVAEVGSECESPGGVSEPGVMTWLTVVEVVVVVVVFSVSFLRLMIILIFSF